MINVVIPMAGLGSRFSKQGYSDPKPFIDVLGKPMFVRVMENISLPDVNFILVCRKEHEERCNSVVQEHRLNATIVATEKVTLGTACTVLLARKAINSDQPLLIANSDQIVELDFKAFIVDAVDRNLDGSILTFRDEEKNPKWSFAAVNPNGRVVEVKEKDPISEFATVGIYYFSKGKEFIEGCIDMIAENDAVNGEFYTCPVYNYLIREDKKIGHFEMLQQGMHGIGTPDDLNAFLSLCKERKIEHHSPFSWA